MSTRVYAIFLILTGFLPQVCPPAHAAAEKAPFNLKQIKKVKTGMTRSEVAALAGKPGKIEKKPDGGEVWIYEDKKKKTSPPAPDLPFPQPEESLSEVRLKVIFDSKGMVSDTKRRILNETKHSYLVPPDNVEPVEADPAEQGS